MRADSWGNHGRRQTDAGGQRLLLLMEHEENRGVLGDWLDEEYQLVDATADHVPDVSFDLCIVDRAALDEHGEAIAERRAAEAPVVLPVLVVVTNRALQGEGEQRWHGLDVTAPDRFDEVITTPIEKAELRRRVETLLHQRRLSLQLREQREQYRQLLGVTPVTIAAVHDGDIAFVNERGAALLGADEPDALVGDSLLQYVYEDDRDEVAELLERAVTDREAPNPLDCRVVVDDDEERYVELAGVALPTPEETAVQVVVRDVTERLERVRAVERQRDHLARLNRLNQVIREIDRTLVRADSREEIEAAVCDGIVDAAGLRLAWIGRVTASSAAIEKRVSAGDAPEYVERITPTTDVEASGGDGPASRAARTREVQVVDDLYENPAFEPWYDDARDAEIASCIVVPLLYEETLYGVLAVYAAETEAFGKEERAVFEALGATIAHAINATESRRALVADRIYELAFEIRDDHFLSTVTADLDVTFELEGLVSRGDTYAKYLVAETAEPDRTLERAEDAPDVTHVRLVTESDGEALFEFSFDHDLVTQTFGALGATVRAMTVADGRFDITAEVPYATDVASFVAAVEAKHDEVSLLAQRETERPLQTRQEVWQTFEDSLTDRQWAVLQTAYYAGFFDWPRGSTGEEVAGSLGISASTFHEHLRGAQRKLLSVLFER